MNETAYVQEINKGDDPSRTIEKVLNYLRYDDLEDFFKWNIFDPEESKFKIVLFVKDKGRSHAYQMKRMNKLGLAVIYCVNSFGNKKLNHVISHEILHQFGAWDLYHEIGRNQTEKSSKLIREKYYNSIMLATASGYDLVIDEVTASLIGWGPYKEEYNIFNRTMNQKDMKKEARNERMKSAKIKFNLKKKKTTTKN